MKEKMSDRLLQENRVLKLAMSEWSAADLYRQCLRALQQEDLQNVYVSWMMALVFIQSQGKPYFESDSGMLRGRLNKMPFATNAERRDWQHFVMVQQGENQGLVPKFEYDARLKYEFEAYPAHGELPYLEQMIVCCRWGVSQMPGIMFWMIGKKQNLLIDFRRFTSDPDLQLRVLARWIKKCCLATTGTPEKIFGRFFYESGPTTRESKVEIAMALNQGFSEIIASRELIQCLYQNPASE
jgi:hypothetical protein